mgnify:CR=1 FL=1
MGPVAATICGLLILFLGGSVWIGISLFLVGIGLVMVFNASIPISQAKFQSTHFLFFRQLAWAAAGLADDVRDSILGLRSTISPGVGLAPAIREYARRFSEQSGIEVSLSVADGATASFGPPAEVQILRIIGLKTPSKNEAYAMR